MSKFKIIALSVSGISGQIFSAGQIVGKDAFEEGTTDKLVAEGFIAPYSGKEPTIHEGSTEHIVSEADVEANPGQGLVAGETIYLPKAGFVMVDTDQKPQNESGATHDGGKVLLDASQALDPNTKQATLQEPSNTTEAGTAKPSKKK